MDDGLTTHTEREGESDADLAWNKSFQTQSVSIILEYISRRHTIKIWNVMFWFLVRLYDFMKWKDKQMRNQRRP